MALTNQEFLEKAFINYYNKISKHNARRTDFIPRNLIRTYFLYMDHLPFEKVADNYRRKYILNENKLESVHNRLERAGLRVVYDYVLSDDWKKMKNIYVLLELHIKLYSKVPNPEFGGKFRNANAYISKSDIKTSDYSMISAEVAALYSVYTELLEDASRLVNSKDEELLFSYLERAIELKCRLIEIHPFADGNGRSCRALLNILLRNIGLPPVYIKNKEKDEYIEAMDMAVRNKDFSLIKTFYFYKICDSIYDLDISERRTNGLTVKELAKKIKDKNNSIEKLNHIFMNKEITADKTIEDATYMLNNSSKLNSLISKLFEGRVTRNDLRKIDDPFLLTLIDIYVDEYDKVILEDEFDEEYLNKISALNVYLQEIQDYSLLSRNHEDKLIKRYKKTKNKNIRTLIVNSFQKVIYSTAKRYSKDEDDLLNFIQEANIILLECMDTYELDSKYRFSTYAMFNIRKKLDNTKVNRSDVLVPELSDMGNVLNVGSVETPEDSFVRDTINENTFSLLQSVLDEDELYVASTMFDIDLDGVYDIEPDVVNSIKDNKERESKIRRKLMKKLQTNKMKKLLNK